ncbi:MAG: hemerythrin domain-containing protein [Myxococcales bacterium]|nr:hemerythrin domain-containing protein [Myxococcales bacterium]
MNIYDRLQKDHEAQKSLAAQLEDTSGDSEQRRKLFAELRSEAEAHANAEEQTFYAALIENPESQEKARHSIAEHKTASDLLEELSNLEMSSSGWLQKFKQFKDELEHHIDEEENEVFKLAREVLAKNEAESMVSVFERRKADEL